MNPPKQYGMHDSPCVNCGKNYVGKEEMGRIVCLNPEEDSCKLGHMWCRKCWEANYAVCWDNFCPMTMGKKNIDNEDLIFEEKRKKKNFFLLTLYIQKKLIMKNHIRIVNSTNIM